MALEFTRVTFLRIYTGEDVILGDEPLYKAILKEARRLGLAGGTAIKAISGFSKQVRGGNNRISYFVSGVADAPIIIDIVDEKERVASFLPWLEKNAKRSLVTVRETDILMTDYIRQRKQELAQQKVANQPTMQVQQQ